MRTYVTACLILRKVKLISPKQEFVSTVDQISENLGSMDTISEMP